MCIFVSLQIYTFGSPRAGDSMFADYVAGGFQGKTFRLVHAADIVPKVGCPFILSLWVAKRMLSGFASILLMCLW